MRTLLIASLGLLLLTGCTRDPAYDKDLAAEGPFALSERVVWVIGSTGEVALYNPTDDTVERIELGIIPLTTHVRDNGVFIQAAGGESRWLPVGPNGVEFVHNITLSTRYKQAIFDGDSVLLHTPISDEVGGLQNPNQVAIVPLTGDGEPVERTLRSLGGAPSGMSLTPVAHISGADRQLCWVMANRTLLVFDLMAPEAPEVMVPLTLEGDERSILPTQVVLDEGSSSAFVRAEGTNDIFSLIFPPDAPEGEVPRPHLNQLAAGQRPTDLVVRRVADGMRAFTIDAQDQTISVLHPVSGRRIPVELGSPVRHMLPFEGPDGGHQALVWSPESQVVFFIDLETLESSRSRAVTPMVLADHIETLIPVPGMRMAVAQTGLSRLVLLDFETETANPLDAQKPITSVLIEGPTQRMHVHTGLAVATVELTTGAVSTVPVSWGALLPRLVAGRLVISHSGLFGELTVAEAGDRVVFKRDHILLEGILDR